MNNFYEFIQNTDGQTLAGLGIFIMFGLYLIMQGLVYIFSRRK